MFYRLVLATVILAAFVLDYHFAPGGAKIILSFDSGLIFIYSLVFTWSWILFWDVFFPKKARWITPLLMGFMTLIHYYEFNIGGDLDAAVILDNWRGVADAQGLKLLAGLLHDNFVAANVFWSLLIGGIFFVTYKERRSRLFEVLSARKKIVGLVPFALLLFMTFSFSYTFENYVGLFRSLVYRVRPPVSRFAAWTPQAEKALSGQTVQSQFKNQKPPNVIVVFVESLSSYFVKARSPMGLEYLPTFNALLEKGLYFEKHYSVSVQTLHGQFAALCGKIPVYQGLESLEYQDRDFDCLPKYLKKRGYKSIFMQAFGKVNFDNTKKFFLLQGFDESPQVAFTCDQEKEGVPCWNWGISDDEFYRRAFKQIQNEKGPLFVTLATITSHMPFTGAPDDLIVHYKKPKSRLENYLNSLTVVDLGIKTFLLELEKSPQASNTVVIFTGDHGFPMGQHGNFHNENYAYEENFRVPFLILDFRTKKLLPVGRRETPSSHMHLPATVLDIVGFKGPTHFLKGSVLSVKKQDDPIYLVQPYSGVMLGSVRWPWKYVHQLKTKREYIYNLQNDPEEKDRLEAFNLPAKVYEEFQMDVETIMLSNRKLRKGESPVQKAGLDSN